jgi:hypothetical protein
MVGCDRDFSKAMQLICSAVDNRLAAVTYGGRIGVTLSCLADERIRQAMVLVNGGLQPASSRYSDHGITPVSGVSR